ncbi:Piso0_000179 [Millerozyma farinosa CBS 7064]|uniref:60S ribosomal protein L13 n=1 Tax=Pichia sorbitophila (strain ATCC MYA-4447 / BCRC 22081 / CBS 7064 / NBRC 10061 / NRRL Y-12695) TaxID=559304 RepID=G8YTA5_PICSO|nr:Piso0_000179 [Millerozyma farinosa CBS 7064]
MAVHHNLPLLKNHFRKHWQERVRVHLDQAGKKASRRQARLSKAAKIAPKPLDKLRPVVRAPTIKYNRKLRAGRGFTLTELKAAGVSPRYARSIGIAVDHRRQNRSEETFDANVARLKEYLSKVVIFDNKTKASEAANHAQVDIASVFPTKQAPVTTETQAVEQVGESSYRALRLARSNKKYKGIREKRAKEKAESEADKKKK